jgi:hypothetical protein
MVETKRRQGGQPGHKKYGGRKVGTPNRTTIMRAEAMAQWVELRPLTPEEIDTITPLDALLYILRVRLAAGEMHHAAQVAAMAAPYVHVKLSAHAVEVRHTYAQVDDAELAEQRAALERKLASVTIEAEAEPVG